MKEPYHDEIAIFIRCQMNQDAKPTVETIAPAKVLRRFRVVFNAIRTHFRQIEKQVGLGGAQVWALSIITNNPGIGMGGIATNMDIHQSTASNLIKVCLLYTSD